MYYSRNFEEVVKIIESIENKYVVLLENAKQAIKYANIKDELFSIDSKYSRVVEYLDKTISEGFTVNNAHEMIKAMDLPKDNLNLKQFLENKLAKTDFYEIVNCESSPHIDSLMLKCPSTSVAVERSFSMLGKLLRNDRRFSSKNIAN